MNIKLDQLFFTPLWQSLLNKDKVYCHSDLLNVFLFKRENHSMYIAYVRDGHQEYIGEYDTHTLIYLLKRDPLDKQPVKISDLIDSYDFRLVVKCETYLCCTSPLHSKNQWFFFKILNEDFCSFESDDLSPYHFQAFLDSNIDLNKY